MATKIERISSKPRKLAGIDVRATYRLKLSGYTGTLYSDEAGRAYYNRYSRVGRLLTQNAHAERRAVNDAYARDIGDLPHGELPFAWFIGV